MKTEFDLNKLTDADVELIEESLFRRRILKMCNPDGYPLFNQAISAGFRPHELCSIVAPNYGNADRSIFAQSRQSGKNPENALCRTLDFIKPHLENVEFIYEQYTPSVCDQITEEHEQYNAAFNQFRSSKYLPKIELKIGNLYELKLGENIKQLHLVRIDGNIKHFPELYFSENSENSRGTNVSVYKILKEVK